MGNREIPSSHFEQTPEKVMEGVSAIMANGLRSSSFWALKTDGSLWTVWRKRAQTESSFEFEYREYAFENAHLKREIAAYDQKHSEEVERLTKDFSVKIKNLTEEITDEEKDISEQASGIARLELEIKTKEEAIQKSEADVELWKSIYSDAYDVGEYACRKLGQDFERCLHMRNDNYRLSYIFGDERSR